MSDLIIEQVGCKNLAKQPYPFIKKIIEPKEKDLGGFSVRRLLPTSQTRSIGPFVFFDHLGPVDFSPGQGIDVRPHPHIGLATITYVFEGEILHRDSLGNVQFIRPNEVNWMTAGKGIAHSERTPPELRAQGHTLHALQLWVALPQAEEQTEPFFIHYGSAALPLLEDDKVSIRVMAGEAYGVRSAVKVHSPMLYAEVNLKTGAAIVLPDHLEECAVYVVSGEIVTAGTDIPRHRLAVFNLPGEIELAARQDSRLVIIGGTPLGERIMWWNLVASRKDLIEQAKQAWQERVFPKVPGETEFIPLPD